MPIRYRKFLLLLLALVPFLASSSAWAGKNGRRWDKTPDTFSFVDQTGIALNSSIAANTITVSGINTAINISITGGEYSINGSGFNNVSSKVSNSDTIIVRQISSDTHLTTTSTLLNLNGVTDSFDVTTLGNISDSTPDTFNFVDQLGVALSSDVTSNAITVSGINVATSISVTGGQFSINGGAFTSEANTVSNGSNVIVQLSSSSTYSSITQAVLTIGGVSDTFSVTTLDNLIDITPDAFSFIDQIDVALDSVNVSNTMTVSGINTATSISISNGEYAINGSGYTSVDGNVENGNTVSIRQTASSVYQTTINTVLTIGGVSDTYSTTTIAEEH